MYIQTIVDAFLITGLVYVTAGINSIYSVFYPLVIIYSVLYVGRGGSLIVASVCGILYGLLLDLEYYSVIISPTAMLANDYHFSAGYVFARIFIHLLSFHLIALIASYAVERERTEATDAPELGSRL